MTLNNSHGWHATVKVRNRRVAQENPGTKRIAIGFPDGETFIFEIDKQVDASLVRKKLLDWLFAHLDDNGVVLPDQDVRTDYQ